VETKVFVLNREGGQTLTLFALFLGAAMMCLMAVVDVGFFLHERQEVQTAADAAALAGAQELPDDPDAAEALALEYLEKNGVSADDVEISFRCTSGVDAICDESEGRYDTIVVTPTSRAPVFFAPLLSVVGLENCWNEGCHVNATAAGCRGACGPLGTGPADVIMALDHSYSMQPGELTNAKEGVLTMFSNFNHEYQRVGLTVTPPVNPNDQCDTVNEWTDPQTWLTAGLTANYQSTPHVLNSGSEPVAETNCMDRADWTGGELNDFAGHTNVGEPIKAAAQELAANGRTVDENGKEVKHGIVLITDGAANVSGFSVTSGSTGMRFCTSLSAQTSGSGDNNGFQTGASGACNDGGGFAADDNSGTGNSTSCTSNQKDRHRFWGFDAGNGVPSGSTINGIQVRLDAWAAGASPQMCVQLSWDGGSTYTNPVVVNLPATEAVLNVGSSTHNWGRTWTTGELANLRVRLTMVSPDPGADFRLDALGVNVHYATLAASSQGPCEYAYQQAQAAKALGIEIYVIAWGADDKCQHDPVSSAWRNVNADVFLRALATDEAHFFDEPKTTDLEPIFEAIGAQLAAGGSKLVE
jgi:hypothetical protein